MTHIMSVLYHTTSLGSEMEVFVGQNMKEINEAFTAFQRDIHDRDTLEYVERAVLVKIDEENIVRFFGKVQFYNPIVLTDKECDS
jgi:hypothetical protein